MTNRLTDRQIDVLRVVCDGCSIKETAAALSLSPRTITHHLTRIYRALTELGAIRPGIANPKAPACVWWHRGLAAYQGKD